MQPYPQQLPPLAGLWRQGKVLVMHKLAPLPDVCVKSNEPAARRLKRKVQWHHPAITLSIFAGVLVYIILAAILTKRATILLPLSEPWHARRKRRLIFAWCAGLGCLGLMILGFVLVIETNEGIYALLLLVGFVGSLIALIGGQAAVAMVSPKRMTDDYLWLKGVHPDFLNRLPEWPYQI